MLKVIKNDEDYKVALSVYRAGVALLGLVSQYKQDHREEKRQDCDDQFHSEQLTT